MILSKRTLIATLVFPIAALVILSAYKASVFAFGREFSLRVRGYDPRDLLSGHYVTYTVDYQTPNMCFGGNVGGGPSTEFEGYVCLSRHEFSQHEPDNCDLWIRGTCRYSRFEAGIEKFFIPEAHAQELDNDVRAGNGSIVISIPSSGRAQVKTMLITGREWNSRE